MNRIYVQTQINTDVIKQSHNNCLHLQVFHFINLISPSESGNVRRCGFVTHSVPWHQGITSRGFWIICVCEYLMSGCILSVKPLSCDHKELEMWTFVTNTCKRTYRSSNICVTTNPHMYTPTHLHKLTNTQLEVQVLLVTLDSDSIPLCAICMSLLHSFFEIGHNMCLKWSISLVWLK